MAAKHEKCIITAALAGAATRKEQNPNVPYTRDEFVSDAVKCYENGASVVHIHARDPEHGAPTPDLDILGAIVEGIRAECPIIINLSTAISPFATKEQRIAVIETFKPEMAVLRLIIIGHSALMPSTMAPRMSRSGVGAPCSGSRACMWTIDAPFS